MISVKMKNMTGSETIKAELYPESGLIAYDFGNKRIWNHVTSLSSKGWEVFEEIIVKKEPVVKITRSKKKKAA